MVLFDFFFTECLHLRTDASSLKLHLGYVWKRCRAAARTGIGIVDPEEVLLDDGGVAGHLRAADPELLAAAQIHQSGQIFKNALVIAGQ